MSVTPSEKRFTAVKSLAEPFLAKSVVASFASVTCASAILAV